MATYVSEYETEYGLSYTETDEAGEVLGYWHCDTPDAAVRMAKWLVDCDAQPFMQANTVTMWVLPNRDLHLGDDPEYDAWIDNLWQQVQDFQALSDDALEHYR